VVGIVTRLRAEQTRGSNPGKGNSKTFRPALGPTKHPVECLPGLLLGNKSAGA
jgi:hypothetical protein